MAEIDALGMTEVAIRGLVDPDGSSGSNLEDLGSNMSTFTLAKSRSPHDRANNPLTPKARCMETILSSYGKDSEILVPARAKARSSETEERKSLTLSQPLFNPNQILDSLKPYARHSLRSSVTFVIVSLLHSGASAVANDPHQQPCITLSDIPNLTGRIGNQIVAVDL